MDIHSIPPLCILFSIQQFYAVTNLYDKYWGQLSPPTSSFFLMKYRCMFINFSHNLECSIKIMSIALINL